tara:strand:+ start:907 stop:1119 length:213 start_codon:yes stop_codon:yes gene_type:complete
MGFTETESEKYTLFYRTHKLSVDENECFIELMYAGMPYKTCEKTLLEARVKAQKVKEPEPEPEPEPESAE